MTRVVLDLETASLTDLKLSGVHVYAADPSTRVTVLCYAIDDGPVRIWTGGACPPDLAAAVTSSCVMVAHNYLFELNIWAAKLVPLGFPEIALEQWSCTMARALVAGLPASLELAGHALGLRFQKDASARDLMLRFARPRAPEPLTWWHETDPVRFQRLCQYCAQDVLAERDLDQAIPELDRREREIFLADHAINTLGLRVNLSLAGRMEALGQHERTRLNQRLNRLTNGRVTSAAQVSRMALWLLDNHVPLPTAARKAGEPETPTLGREAVEHLLRRPGLPAHVQAVLECRRDASRSSTAKLVTIRRSVDADARLRGTMQYYGANRTGRWAGRRFQPQNLPRGTIKDIQGAVTLIEAGAPAEDIELLGFEDSVMGVLASSLRSVIEAAPGNLLVACDLAQIEARVLVWLSGQEDMVQVFARGEDVYTYTAARLGSSNRQFGKVLVLALGYGMGPARFTDTAAGYGVKLTPEEAKDAVTTWRDLNSRVVDLWWGLHRAAVRVLEGPLGSQAMVRGLVLTNQDEGLAVRLPSGRFLLYREARTQQGDRHGYPEVIYRGVEQGRWAWLRTYPGKLAENITQAVARDVMCEGLVMAYRRRVPLVATVHDELVAEIEAERAPALRDWMLWAMRRPIAWAKGLPLAADARVGRRYRKDPG